MTRDPDAMWQPGFESDSDAPSPDPTPAGESVPPAPWDELTATTPTDTDFTPSTDSTPSTTDTRAEVRRPGHVEIVLDGPSPDPPASPPPVATTGRRGWRAPVWVVVIAVVAMAGALVVRSGGDTEQVAVDPVAGADQRRIAGTADRLWTTTIGLADGIVGEDSVQLTQFFVADRTSVLALLPAVDDTSIAVGLDALTGAEQWRRPFDFGATDATILGVVSDTAVVEQNDLDSRHLIGLDVASGNTTWELPTSDNGVHVILSGTSVITRVSFTGNARLTFIDPTTGIEVSRANGRLIGTDLAGTWYVEAGRRISAIDLSDGAGQVTDIAERTDGWNGPTAVVDGRVIVLDDDGTIAEAPRSDGPLVPLVATGGDLPDIVSFVATGGSTLMAIGDGRVLGIDLVGGDAEIRWSADASVRVVNVTDRGMLVALSDATLGFANGADLVVVEPITGERLATAGPAPGTDDLPLIVGNGFVITNAAQLGFERIGHDLEGTELWRLASNDPIRFGDRLMVTVNVGANGYAFSGFGDAA